MSNGVAYPNLAEHMVRVPLEELRTTLLAMLKKVSMFEFDSKVAVQRMIDADLHGLPQHGVGRICEYLDAVDLGDIDPRGRVLTLVDSPAFAVLDGSRAIGSVAATKGIELAVAKAKECGTGTVAVGNSQTLGALGVYATLAAAEGCICFCCTSTGGVMVSAPGTSEAAVGNNAFAWAIPTAEESPLLIDSSCGTASRGKLNILQELGIPIPEGVLQSDAENAPLLPRGGAMGFGMALACSALAGPLAGGKMPNAKKKAIISANDSEHFFYVIDVSHFADLDGFKKKVTEALAEIRQLPPTNAAEPVRIPGDRARAMSDGESVPLLMSSAEQIRQRAAKMKIDVTW
ncbi:MAG: Ldh family oxidoreductase [Planctomycetaceae bacterium]|nr:Ldh family oxidoreductase [Planctomycetaceae bacterium]